MSFAKFYICFLMQGNKMFIQMHYASFILTFNSYFSKHKPYQVHDCHKLKYMLFFFPLKYGTCHESLKWQVLKSFFKYQNLTCYIIRLSLWGVNGIVHNNGSKFSGMLQISQFGNYTARFRTSTTSVHSQFLFMFCQDHNFFFLFQLVFPAQISALNFIFIFFWIQIFGRELQAKVRRLTTKNNNCSYNY